MKLLLQTVRLNLDPFDTADTDLLYQTLINPFVKEYLMDDETISYDKAKEFSLMNEQSFEKSGWGLWKLLLKEEKRYVGFAGLWRFFGEEQPQLLYALLPDFVQRGYATEASKAVIDYAFHQLKFNYLIAACDSLNMVSRKVCERLNMIETEEREIEGKKTAFYKLYK